MGAWHLQFIDYHVTWSRAGNLCGVHINMCIAAFFTGSICLPVEEAAVSKPPLGVRSKWELVDYGEDSDEEEESG